MVCVHPHHTERRVVCAVHEQHAAAAHTTQGDRRLAQCAHSMLLSTRRQVSACRTCVQIARMSSCGVCAALTDFPDLLQRMRLTVSVAPPAAVQRLLPAAHTYMHNEKLCAKHVRMTLQHTALYNITDCTWNMQLLCSACEQTAMTYHPKPRQLGQDPRCGWALLCGS